MSDRARLIAVARGDAPADLLITGARVFSAHTREWLDGTVAIADGRIAGVGAYHDGAATLDGGGRFLVPGFIDAHVHIESSKLVPAEFARAVVPLGTTTVVADPHEVANVVGAGGVTWMLEATEGLPLRVFLMAPSCVPASPFESSGRTLDAGDLAGLLAGGGRVLGVGEMMNFPGVIAGDPDVLAKLDAAGGRPVDGHAPGVRGRELDAYVAAGIGTDHEATSWEEALEKRRRGMWVLLREASNARNLLDGLELTRRHGPDWTAFCTDDREPETLFHEGHLDDMCRQAVGAGITPEDALVMASLHPARCHGLRDLGAIAPGYHADLLLLDDLEGFSASTVLVGGQVVARDGIAEPFDRPAIPSWLFGTVRPAPVCTEDLSLGPPLAGDIRVIDIVPGQLLTGAGSATPAVADGVVVADPARDLAKMAVVERHHATGRVGTGVVRGFGLTDGAFASTVAHDHHNIVVVGVDDASMLACIERLTALGGGIVVASGGVVAGQLPLPVAGLLSEAPIEEVVAKAEELTALLATLGVTVATPFMTLSFLALSVIPSLKLTDHGLIDVAGARVVPLAV